MKESSAHGLLSIRIQEFIRLVQSCPIVIIKLRYHNSSLLRPGTRLQVIPFDFETMYLWSSLSDFLNFLGYSFWSSVLPKVL